MKHVIFYDGECPLCNRVVRFLLRVDRKKQFCFAPLNGRTAENKLAGLRLKDPELDTLVLLQNFNTGHEKLLIEGRAALRIFWLLGGKYSLLGILSFLPSFFADYIYRITARHRFRLFKYTPEYDKDPSRFLP